MQFTDRKFLQKKQYQDPANLDARIRLHDLFSVNPSSLHHWLFDQAVDELPPDIRILEVGAGHGKLWTNNAERIPAGWQVHLTDLSAGMLSAGQRALPENIGMSFSFSCADAQDLPFETGSFDAIFAHFMLYHVPDRKKAFADFRRVLMPGGFLFAATLGKNHLKMIYDILERIDPQESQGGWELPFRLDNGLQELSAAFVDVHKVSYDDHLEVTQVEPLLDYIRSMASRTVVDVAQIENLRFEMTSRIQKDGMIRIEKESGMFIGRRRGD